MSGIVGICRLSTSIETQLLESMIEGLAHRGPDGKTHWSEGNIGFASRLLKTTPESENELPITTSFDHRFKLVWDGRIDNREELINHFPALLTAPDPELFIQAYGLWGKDCLTHIIGEFAFALWDRTENELFAARDRVGLKPFHYTWDGNQFAFSSEIKPLFKVLGGMPGFDDEMVLSFLSYRNFKEEDQTRTFFKSISRLAPSHSLSLKNGQLSITRYASWDLETRIYFEDPKDYASEFKKIFDEAVRCRLRSRGKITAMLSGGHDSSAIVSTAASLLKKQDAPLNSLDALNLYTDNPLTDERYYARDVAEEAGIALHALFSKTSDLLPHLDGILHKAESPLVCASANSEPFEFLQNSGVRVILNGEGGDQVLDEFGFGADLLAEFKIFEFLKKSTSFSQEFNDNPLDFVKESIQQVIPQQILNLRRKIAGTVPARWLNQNTVHKLNFSQKSLRSDKRPHFSSYSQAATYFEVTRPYQVMKLELDERAWAQYGIEMRCPFFDSRLIQFMLSIPKTARCSGIRKQILKDAMKGIVPESVSARKDKGNYSSETDGALLRLLTQPQSEVLCNRSRIVQNYVSLDKVKQMAEKYLSGHKDLRFDLWFLITTDHLLYQFSQGENHDAKEKRKEKVQLALAD